MINETKWKINTIKKNKLQLFTIKMYGQILFNIQPKKRALARKYENQYKKLIRNNQSRKLNETCLKENIQLKYINDIIIYKNFFKDMKIYIFF